MARKRSLIFGYESLQQVPDFNPRRAAFTDSQPRQKYDELQSR
jgi:hypothetical protein